MSKTNQVPTFGNWDANDEVPMTIAFERARADHKGGTGGGNGINPNDPFQNPAAFGTKATKPARFSQRALQQFNTNESQKRADTERPGPNTSGFPVRSAMVDHTKKGSLGRMHNNEESSLEGVPHSEQTRSYPSSSLRLHPGNRSAVLAYLGPEKKDIREGTTSLRHPPSERRHLRPVSRREILFPGKGSPLPKFGAWDAKDPTAGDGFTLMFGNARKEKIIGGPIPIRTCESEISVKQDYEDVYGPPPQSLQQKVVRWLCFARS